jgi:transposase InsO family protein
VAGENRVARLCSQERIWSIHAKKRGLNRKAGPPVHDDLVKRVFTAPAPNLVWLTDITEHATSEGKLYLCAIKDVYSNRIVGYSIDSRVKASLAVSALRNAVALRAPAAGLIVHSDRGSQVQEVRPGPQNPQATRLDGPGRSLRRQRRHGVLLRAAPKEHPGPATLDSRHELRLAIVSWIETRYHRRRRQSRLGKLTPIEFEMIQPAALAV